MSNLPPKYDPTGAGMPQSDEETDAPLLVDHRNFYKVEKWSKDGAKVEAHAVRRQFAGPCSCHLPGRVSAPVAWALHHPSGARGCSISRLARLDAPPFLKVLAWNAGADHIGQQFNYGGRVIDDA